MTIRCFLPLSQWDAYLMIYRKYYYKWTKHPFDWTDNLDEWNNIVALKELVEDYVKHHCLIGMNKCIFREWLASHHEPSYMLNRAIGDALYHKQFDIAKLLINKGTIKSIEWDEHIYGASSDGYWDIVKYLKHVRYIKTRNKRHNKKHKKKTYKENIKRKHKRKHKN